MFKDVVGYEDYFSVSENGEIFSKRTNKILIQGVSKTGYKVLSSRIGGRKGKSICLKVHRMIAEAFIPNPNGYPIINHIDGDKLNNSLDNLEWCTHQQNSIHAIVTGLNNPSEYNSGSKNHNSKVTENDVIDIRNMFSVYEGKKRYFYENVASIYGISPYYIKSLVYRRSWKHI